MTGVPPSRRLRAILSRKESEAARRYQRLGSGTLKLGDGGEVHGMGENQRLNGGSSKVPSPRARRCPFGEVHGMGENQSHNPIERLHH